MYRQVKIHPSQQDLLRIVWKTSVDSPLKTYRLTTVTYASPVVKNNFYVDDVLSGAPDLETAIEIQQQLIGMMNSCGMHLYKWCSNSGPLLSKVSTDDREYVAGNDDHTSVKALGLSWNPKMDYFHFTLKMFPQPLRKEQCCHLLLSLARKVIWVGHPCARISSERQASFQRHWCTSEQIVRLSQKIKDGLHRKQSTFSVFVDFRSWFPVAFLATCINGLRVFLTEDLLVLGMAIRCLALGKPDRVCLWEQL
ncbi:uncharacterized protein TNCV_4897391 [Trichonephila clavipes]|nr:uncharacterized protein TNCV_4897391 [Trichonephila clavipes]